MNHCGTRLGYQIHQTEDTRPCEDCLRANSNAVKASRIRLGQQKALNIPVEVLLQTLDTYECTALRDFLGEEIIVAIHRAPKARSAATP